MRTVPGIFGALSLAAILAASIHAQPAYQQQPALKSVDPGVADMGPLATQGRETSKDIRQPSGFDRVYEIEMNGQKYFARINGGMIAVFPRSTYNARGMPVVPPGTTFYIGKLPANATIVDSGQTVSPNYAVRPASASPSAYDGARPFNNAINLSAPTPVSAQSSAIAQNAVTMSVTPPTANLWESETYRVTRVAELITAARQSRVGNPNRTTN